MVDFGFMPYTRRSEGVTYGEYPIHPSANPFQLFDSVSHSIKQKGSSRRSSRKRAIPSSYLSLPLEGQMAGLEDLFFVVVDLHYLIVGKAARVVYPQVVDCRGDSVELETFCGLVTTAKNKFNSLIEISIIIQTFCNYI